MFRLIRVAILVILAFVAGILWGERNGQRACTLESGEWRNGACYMTE